MTVSGWGRTLAVPSARSWAVSASAIWKRRVVIFLGCSTTTVMSISVPTTEEPDTETISKFGEKNYLNENDKHIFNKKSYDVFMNRCCLLHNEALKQPVSIYIFNAVQRFC
jgi:hypothetical protein